MFNSIFQTHIMARMVVSMKKAVGISAAVVCLCILLTNTVSGIQSKVNVSFNNSPISSDVKIIDGKPYVDAVAFSNSVGMQAVWDGKANTLKVAGGSNDAVIPEVIKEVSPCVVGIIGMLETDSGRGYGSDYEKYIVHGTGLIIKSNGEILTNAHVVQDMKNIIVVLADGNGYVANLKCLDADSDLAVVKIEKSGLPAAKFGTDSDIVTGRTVIAIGTPISFSLRNSASTGVISGVNRGIDSYYKLIQTDASINPGNSGGPLVNLQGNVIGINSSKFSGEGIEGLGFSIPVGTIKYVLGQFDKYGHVVRPYLGAVFEEEWAAKIGLPTNNGLTVTGLDDGSPAQKWGLKPGDVVLKVGGAAVNTIVDYNEIAKKYSPGGKADFIVKRGGTVKTISITFGEK